MNIRAVSMVAALFATLFTPKLLLAGDAIPPIPVRIVTINVREGIGSPGQSAREALGDYLTVIDENPGDGATGLLPDIVCLQECRSITNINLFRDDFLPGYAVSRVVSTDFGGNFNAILTSPDFDLLNVDVLPTNGPRPVIRVHVQPPGALGVLSVYSAHFKAFGDSASQATRTGEANTSGVRFFDEFTNGADVTDDGIPDFTPEQTVIAFAGDLNSGNNADGTLDGMFTNFQNGMPTGGENLPYESIAGAGIGGPLLISTFGSGSRLDYVVLDSRTAMTYDADMNGSLSTDEVNSIGFVYFAGDDGGMMANGNTSATSAASDHRPVVVDLFMEADPDQFFAPTDINQDDFTNADDLALWETLFSMGSATDVNDDSTVDEADGLVIRDAIRENEIADVNDGR